MRIIDCTPTLHGHAILSIFNDVIATSTALYEYQPRDDQSMAAWFRGKAEGRFPVVVALDDQGRVSGFATYGPFRSFPAYKYTVEHSVYVHRDHRGQGIGTALMRHLVACATGQNYHAMIGVVDGSNTASVSLHERLGFIRAGVIRQAGFKFGRWLDVEFFQLLLPTPGNPVDG
jgi:phosphinothricin acetyltransferase